MLPSQNPGKVPCFLIVLHNVRNANRCFSREGLAINLLGQEKPSKGGHILLSPLVILSGADILSVERGLVTHTDTKDYLVVPKQIFIPLLGFSGKLPQMCKFLDKLTTQMMCRKVVW